MDYKIVNIELKTSNLCNAKCEYCYVPEFSHPEKLTIDNLKKVFKYFSRMKFDTPCILHFLWHGGEPSLMKPKYYYEAVSLQKQILGNHKVINFLQTNGLRLSNDLVTLFEQESFLLGISIDGPIYLHDKLRRDKNNNPTFETVIKTLTRLYSKNIPVVINCVLRKESLGYLKEIYNLFSNLNAFVTFNILLPPQGDINIETSIKYLSSEDYGDALVFFLKEWLSDDNYTGIIDTFNYLIWSILYNKKAGCFKAECPSYHRAFTPNSKMYMCGRFYGWKDSDLILNMDSPVLNINNKEINDSFPSIDCVDCNIRYNCNGGCPYDRIAFGKSIYIIDSYCASYKMIADFIIANKESIISKINYIVRTNLNATKLFYHNIKI